MRFYAYSLHFVSLAFSAAVALQQSTTNGRGRLPQFPARTSAALFSSSQHPDESESSLSGLVNGMLQAQQEIARENKEIKQQWKTGSRDEPILGKDGVYSILSEKHFHQLQRDNADKLIILKFSSPVCQACRKLKQKFHKLHQSSLFAEKPVVFADVVVSNNKHFHDPFRDFVVSQLKVQKLPTVHLYSTGQLVDTVACDPQGCSWSHMKQQMISFVNRWSPKADSAGPNNGSDELSEHAPAKSTSLVLPCIDSASDNTRRHSLWRRLRRLVGRRQK